MEYLGYNILFMLWVSAVVPAFFRSDRKVVIASGIFLLIQAVVFVGYEYATTKLGLEDQDHITYAVSVAIPILLFFSALCIRLIIQLLTWAARMIRRAL